MIKDIVDLQSENSSMKDKLAHALSPPKGKSTKKSLERTASTSTFYTTTTKPFKESSIVDMLQPELLSHDETLQIISKILQKVVRSKEMVRKMSENEDFKNFSLKLIQNSFESSEFFGMSGSKIGRESLYERAVTMATPINVRTNKGSFF